MNWNSCLKNQSDEGWSRGSASTKDEANAEGQTDDGSRRKGYGSTQRSWSAVRRPCRRSGRASLDWTAEGGCPHMSLPANGDTTARSLSESRDPPRNSSAVFFVRLSELPEQRGFFVEKDKQIREENAQSPILGNSRCAKQCSLPKDYQRHADVHGIAHKSMQASHDEVFRGSNGCGRAETSYGKLPRAAEINRGTHNRANDAQPRQRAAPWGIHSAEQEIGNIQRH